MLRVLLLCAAMIAAVSPSRAAEPQPPPIPVVRTLDDLRKLAPVRLPDGQEVRVGITESAADGAPWRLVYCLPVDPTVPPNNPDGDPEGWLGPVTIRMIGGPPSIEVTGSIEKAAPARPAGETFYCIAVPTSAKGTFQVEVLVNEAGQKAEPRVLFRSPLEVSEAPTCLWHRFAMVDPKVETNSIVGTRPTAARPRFSGMVEHTWPADAKGGLALDGLDPRHPLTLGLDLSIAEPKLTIRCDENLINFPREHLLARWWVNDKPIAAAAAESDAKANQPNGWTISNSREMNVTFALPQTLGELKAGDRVALQLMYCPAGIKPCFTEVAAKKGRQIFVPRIIAHPDTLPRLSDKIEIEVTEQMLKR